MRAEAIHDLRPAMATRHNSCGNLNAKPKHACLELTNAARHLPVLFARLLNIHLNDGKESRKNCRQSKKAHETYDVRHRGQDNRG